MDYTHYLFAGFVFLLICAVLYLNSKLKQGRSNMPYTPPTKPEPDVAAEELIAQYRRLESAMRNLEEEMQDARVEIERHKKEGAAMLASMEQLHSDMRAELLRHEKQNAKKPAAAEELRPIAATMKKKPGPKKKTTADRVRELDATGLDADGIAQELKISRGEVDLVLGLQKSRSV